MGGGGGMEIPNELVVFDASAPGDIPTNHLKKKTYTHNCGNEVPNFIDVAHVSKMFNFSLDCLFFNL